LDVEFLFNHAFRVFGDPEKAYKESLIIIEELANQIDNYENLDIRYMRDLQAMDAFIPERSYVNEFFLSSSLQKMNIKSDRCNLYKLQKYIIIGKKSIHAEF